MSQQGVCLRALGDTTIWAQDESRQLERMYVQGVTAQWDPETAIDWTLTVPFGTKLPPDVAMKGFLDSPLGAGGSDLWNRFRWEHQIWLVSQFYHGEEAALVGAARIAQTARSLSAKKVAAVQVMDEARHADVFGRYLKQITSVDRYPVSAQFSRLVTTSLAHTQWDFAILGVQVLVEGMALAAFRIAETTLHDALIRSIVRLVHQDESRHISFGIVTLRTLYSQLNESERRERTDFLSAAAELTAQRFLLEEVWERLGVQPQMGARFAATNEVMIAYRRAVFTKVIGIIRNVGLLDARLARDLALLGFTVRQ